MNTMNRLLTRRDKNGSHRRSKSKSSDPGSNKSRPVSGNGILSLFKPSDKKQEKDDAKKIQAVKTLLRDRKITGIDNLQIAYSLQTKYANGNVDKAFEILVLFQESIEGIVRPYDPNIHMLGAENRGNVTCYLDALLFAMFARLGNFEPILHRLFEDEPRRRLSSLIRLWVNMLRTGKLIQTDITQHLQEALAACGWEDAAELCQQDTSEAFGFITEKLQLPLLTLEMDIFHEGKGNADDDHKFINERLLEVAVPQVATEGKTVRLEDCLEDYFNARVEVVRRLGRRDTLQRVTSDTSVETGLSTVDEKPVLTEHTETVGAEDLNSTTPTALSTSNSSSPTSPRLAMVSSRHRSSSIIRHIRVAEIDTGESSVLGDTLSVHSLLRKGSLRKEVLMPAWQFFRIIPWYTAQIPTNDAQVAAHFSSTRPVLGICLKRYAMSSQGQPIRLNTTIDIPLQIALPHFIQDNKATEDGPLFGNFNLVLQSIVCHRGTSVHSGHYISLIRGSSQTKDEEPTYSRRSSVDSQLPGYSEDRWIKFDDLASERVTYIDIEKAMAEEMPYLLFYQVQPLVPDTPDLIEQYNRPPSYEDSGIAMAFHAASPVVATVPNLKQNFVSGYFGNTVSPSEESSGGRMSFSDDIDRSRKSLNLLESDLSRRGSLATESSSMSLLSAPITPAEEGSVQTSRISRAASRFGRRGGTDSKSKSRPNSQVDEHRISATFSRLNLMTNKSKEPLNKSQDASTMDTAHPTTSIDGRAETSIGEEVPNNNGAEEEKKDSSNRYGNSQYAFSQITPHKWKKAKDTTEDRECAVM